MATSNAPVEIGLGNFTKRSEKQADTTHEPELALASDTFESLD